MLKKRIWIVVRVTLKKYGTSSIELDLTLHPLFLTIDT
jgi:hypothetical protein